MKLGDLKVAKTCLHFEENFHFLDPQTLEHIQRQWDEVIHNEPRPEMRLQPEDFLKKAGSFQHGEEELKYFYFDYFQYL